MLKERFTLPENIPTHRKHLTVYRTTPDKTDLEGRLPERIERLSTLLGVKGKCRDLGQRMMIADRNFELEIYRASDSFMLSHKRLRYRMEIPSRSSLPAEKLAIEAAEKFMAVRGLKNSACQFKRCAYTECSRFAPGEKKPELLKTEIHVIYGYRVDDLPVLGPGAKLKISLVENERISGVLHFWRELTREDTVPVIAPDEALARLTSDRSFKSLSPEHMAVRLHRIELGYYAMTPTDYQRYLIPVYAVNGTVERGEQYPYRFTHFVVATDMHPDEVKRRAVVANPGLCMVF